MKPIIKWVGGKSQLLDKIIPLIPPQINHYYEPFIGGGSLLLHLLSNNHNIQHYHASDLNPNLICVYQMIQSNPQELINELDKISKDYHSITQQKGNKKPKTMNDALTSQESYYYFTRNLFNQRKEYDPLKAAQFIFLNKTGFRGLYRTGPNGFNVPFGHYTNPTILDKKHIEDMSDLIKNVHFSVCDYQSATQNAQPGDFVYLDPPYAPIKTTSFVSYIQKEFDHKQFVQDCCDLHNNKNVKFLMSNSNAPAILNHFNHDDYHCLQTDARRAINSKKPQSTAKEILVFNYNTPN